MTNPSPFKYFKTSPEIIRLAVMLYIRFSIFAVIFAVPCSREPREYVEKASSALKNVFFSLTLTEVNCIEGSGGNV
jgi:hypothetical protein